jgi:hypothetical protein
MTVPTIPYPNIQAPPSADSRSTCFTSFRNAQIPSRHRPKTNDAAARSVQSYFSKTFFNLTDFVLEFASEFLIPAFSFLLGIPGCFRCLC